jgi:hypothetical protein
MVDMDMVRIANAITELEDHDEIEVTPEMMTAGIKEYGLFDAADRPEWVVWAICQAVLKAAVDSGHIQLVRENSSCRPAVAE